MTDDRERRLQEIRGRVDAITPDIWKASNIATDAWDDAVFMANAPEHVRWLLAEIERLERRVNQLESSIGQPMLDQIDGRAQQGSVFTVPR